MSKPLRESNLEILRIISMILIVMSHCDDIFGLYDLYWDTTGVYKLITDWLNIGGQIGVGCFLLVSGYFMISQKVTARKIFKIAGETWFYSISIWLLWIIFLLVSGNIAHESLKNLLFLSANSLFPLLLSHYWFVSAYIILMLFSPFLNRFINSLSQKEYTTFLAILISITVILFGGFPLILNGIFGSRMMGVFVVYFIAGYIRRFVDIGAQNAKKHFFVAVLFYCLLFFSFYIIVYISNITNIGAIKTFCYFYRSLNSPFVMIICVELFIAFKATPVQYNAFINSIAGSTFAVYLIHSNMIVASKILPPLFPIYKESNPLLILLYSILGIIAIYTVCTIIDLVRKQTIDKVWLNYLNTKFDSHYKCVSHAAELLWKKGTAMLRKYYR